MSLDKPFYLQVNPVAPHVEALDGVPTRCVPAARHAQLYGDVPLPMSVCTSVLYICIVHPYRTVSLYAADGFPVLRSYIVTQYARLFLPSMLPHHVLRAMPYSTVDATLS